MCTLVFPWGKCETQVLPMGLCNGPDVFQEKMSELFEDLEFVRTHIDDLLMTTKGDLKDHLEKPDVVLRRLKRAGLKMNANESFHCQHELEHLGHWITRKCVQPLPNKVEAMRRIAKPKTKTEMRSFTGMVNHCRDSFLSWQERTRRPNGLKHTLTLLRR